METKELLQDYVRILSEENKKLKTELHSYTSKIRNAKSHIQCLEFNYITINRDKVGYLQLCDVLNSYLTKIYNDYVYEVDLRIYSNNKAVLKKCINDLQKENAELKNYTFTCKNKIDDTLQYISEEHSNFYDEEFDIYYVDKFYKQVENILSNIDIPYLLYIA